MPKYSFDLFWDSPGVVGTFVGPGDSAGNGSVSLLLLVGVVGLKVLLPLAVLDVVPPLLRRPPIVYVVVVVCVTGEELEFVTEMAGGGLRSAMALAYQMLFADRVVDAAQG